jgi:hypothetical protein
MMADPQAARHIIRHLKIKRAQDRKAQAQFNRLQQASGSQ